MASVLRSAAIRALEGVTYLRGGARLLVLIYHRVLPAADFMYPFDPDMADFRRQMATLREDFNVLNLGEAIEQLRRDELAPRSVAITFDDGFADNFTRALPVLKELGLPATFFIASGHLGGGCMFNDCVIEACRRAPIGTWATGTAEFGSVRVGTDGSRRELAYSMIKRIRYLSAEHRNDCARRLLETARATPPPGIMMTHEQVRGLHAAGMNIGGHTRSHPILANLGDADAAQEINAGKADLEAIIGGPLALFAYPNGQPGRPPRAGLCRCVPRQGW